MTETVMTTKRMREATDTLRATMRRDYPWRWGPWWRRLWHRLPVGRKRWSGSIWVDGKGAMRIISCPQCGLGLTEDRAMQPNHCPMCGRLWTKRPEPCPDCGGPLWPDGHACSAHPDTEAAVAHVSAPNRQPGGELPT